MLKILLLFFALLHANFAFAQNPGNNNLQIRKALIEHHNRLLKAVEGSTVDQVWAHHAIGLISRQIAEFSHLENLEELREVIQDESAKGLIVKMIGNLRLTMGYGCRTDLNSVTGYGKYSRNPQLVIAFNGLAKELTHACANL